MFTNLLWAPVGYDAREPDLFWIVSNVQPKTENRAAKVPIQAFHDSWLSHIRFEWCKNQLETPVV